MNKLVNIVSKITQVSGASTGILGDRRIFLELKYSHRHSSTTSDSSGSSLKQHFQNEKLWPSMTTFRVFSPQNRAPYSHFWKRAEETPSSYVPKSGRIKFKDKSSDIFMEFLYLLFWVKLVYPTMVFKNFQVGDVQRTGKEKVNDMNRGNKSASWNDKLDLEV